MELIDTHCHLPYLEHKPLEQVLEDAKAVDVKKFLCIGASQGTRSAFDSVTLAEKYPSVFASVGIHPHSAGVNEHGEPASIEPLKELATHDKVLAIGETGLDFFKEWAPFEDQRRVFRETISFAKEIKKPLIIHCRDAKEETFSILKERNAEQAGGVFHCYSESAEFAKQLSDINFLVSLPGPITFKKADTLRAEVVKIPLEQIMLETDCPYMAPEPYRGKPSEPMHVYNIALKLAEVKEISLEEVARVTTQNAKRLFKGL